MTTHRTQIVIAAVTAAALAVAVLVSACGGNGGHGSTPTNAGTAASTNAGAANGSQGGSAQGGRNGNAGRNASASQYHPSNFGDPATGANQWLPLKPGVQWTREGTVNVGNRTLTHQVVSTVTDVSKPVDGVRTVIVLDQDTNGGQIAEQSLDYEAEDEQGNVWYLGSYTESYEGGQFVNASDAWLAGINGSKPGILMQSDPKPGNSFTENTVPGIEAPSAQVVKSGQSQCVPFKCFKDVLVVQEGSEYKYYAPGVGQILTEPQTSGGKQEVEKLVNVTELSPSGLARISAEVVKLDKHTQVTAPDVFGNAPVAKRSL
jgi:hypothetical protein